MIKDSRTVTRVGRIKADGTRVKARERVRMTVYMSPERAAAIDAIAYITKSEKSAVVCAAIDAYLSQVQSGAR